MYCVVFISPNSTTSLPSVRHFMAKRICINLFLCKLLFNAEYVSRDLGNLVSYIEELKGDG